MDRASRSGKGAKARPHGRETVREAGIKGPWLPQYKACFELVARGHSLILMSPFLLTVRSQAIR